MEHPKDFDVNAIFITRAHCRHAAASCNFVENLCKPLREFLECSLGGRRVNGVAEFSSSEEKRLYDDLGDATWKLPLEQNVRSIPYNKRRLSHHRMGLNFQFPSAAEVQ